MTQQNVTEPQATENHKILYTGTVSQPWLKYTSMLHPGWSSTGCSCVHGMDRWQYSSHLLLHALPIASIAL